MTINVSDNSPRINYTATLGQTSFPVPFVFFDSGDLKVYLNGVLKSFSIDYTVTGGSGSTGNITLVVGAALSDKIAITRDVPLGRSTDLTSTYSEAAINDQLDTIIAQIADIDDKASRAIQVNDYELGANVTLPSIDSRKGKTVQFNSTTGALEVGPSGDDLTAIGSVTSEIASLAGISGTLTSLGGYVTEINAVGDNIASVVAVNAGLTNVNTVASGIANVGSVAASIADVNDVADSIGEVSLVAGKIGNIDTVALATTNIGTVAGSITQVNNVASISADVSTVSGLSTAIGTVNTNAASISTVSNSIDDVNDVANRITDVTSVADNLANVGTVAGVSANVSTVAGIANQVSTVAGITGAIATVNTNSADIATAAGASSNISSVAGSITSVNTVAAIAADVTSVAVVSSDIPIVAGSISSVNAVAAEIDALVSIEGSVASASVSAASAAADAIATAADLILTDADATATAADRVQTGLDATATAADRVQTGLNAAATAVSAADATAAASLVNGVVTPFNSEILWPVSLTTLPSGWYDTTQRLLSGTAARAILSNNPLFVYVESDLLPELVLDFAGSSYFVDGTASTLSAATTHVATTNATMTDSDGLIKWRPHNLLTYSEQFDNAAWFKLGSTSLLPNTDVAPDGTTTADELNVVLSTSVIGQDIFGIGVLDRTFSVWVKAPAVGAATAVRLSSNDRISWDTGLSAKVVLTTEWQLVSVSGTLSSGSDVRVNIGGKDETGTGDPDCVGKVLVWGAHLYRSDLGGMVDNPETGDSYVRTADRPIGPELVTNGTFDTDTDWTLVGAGSSITGGEFVGPASGAQGVQQNSPTPLGTNLYRVQFDAYVGSSVSTVYLRLGSNSNAASWTVSTTPNTFSGVVRAGGTNDLIYLLVGGATNLHLDNISVKKVDVNPAIARYMPRTGNHVYNGTSWVNEGLLFESEARTNSLTYSQDFTNAAWSISNSTNNATLVDSKFIPNSGVTGSYFMKSTTVVTGQVYTFTFRVKAAGFNFVELSGDAQSGRLGGRVVFDLLLGTVALEEGGGVGKIVDVGGGVYDCSLTTTAATSTNAWPFMRPRVNATTSATGDGVSGIQLYHAQLEAGSTPSSYIPTNAGASVTRAAETLTVAAADMPWPTPVETTGTELADFSVEWFPQQCGSDNYFSKWL